MAIKLGPQSEVLLRGVHPDLVKVVRRAAAISKLDFKVNEGVRSIARQRALVKAGASQTMKSRHLTGHAVDLVACVDGAIRWDWPLYYKLAETVKVAAAEVNVPVEWGGNWKPLSTLKVPVSASSLSKTFPDGPHFQLPWKQYPA